MGSIRQWVVWGVVAEASVHHGRSLWSVAEAGSVAEAWLLAAEAESVWRWHAGDAGAAGANAG